MAKDCKCPACNPINRPNFEYISPRKRTLKERIHKQRMDNLVASDRTFEYVQANQERYAGHRESILAERENVMPVLQNKKPELLDIEREMFNKESNKSAFIDCIGDDKDILIDETLMKSLNRKGVHKFVLNDKGEINVGTIYKTSPKTLSHPVLAGDFNNVIAAGYIGKNKFGRIYVTNHSGHYQPNKDTLDFVEDCLYRKGYAVKKVKTGSIKHGVLKIFKIL
ncbi:hypothetical protein [Photobacterium damselae]|uniref:hypothetical protein n=1 Tax=Photobacterium damselae TaxID=38293 RepID=UPI001EFECF4C|nr:hypothetical protein [Photobacterium damselae]MCG9780733.1 hypothetical protein [Photobacterium damselae]